jgi:hypothetical protein
MINKKIFKKVFRLKLIIILKKINKFSFKMIKYNKNKIRLYFNLVNDNYFKRIKYY